MLLSKRLKSLRCTQVNWCLSSISNPGEITAANQKGKGNWEIRKTDDKGTDLCSYFQHFFEDNYRLNLIIRVGSLCTDEV